MKEKTYKTIMVGYADNHKKDTYKLYNTDTNRVIMTRYIKWGEWKMIDSLETLKILCNSNEGDIVPDTEEYKTTMSEPKDNLPVHVITDEVESVRPNEKLK